ncbi:MarR family winged helix-turn-helix transcriptional regulator [Herbiconiux liangxiaofengii]|uniref:MarR family winged helix-turn-helix transcriptional regulator n=1 Tax=Herbiconiux liangxiaofengii TaxID=3342795 RepID=UPI0035B9CEFA
MSAVDRVSSIQEEWRRERPDLDVSPQGVIGRLHRLAARLTAELVPVYERFGLGEGEFDVLATLRRAGEPFERAPGELAQHTMVTTGAMSKRLDRLEAAGLVVRRSAGGDGRRRVVALTADGRRLIDEAFAAHMENEARLVATLGERDRRDLERILSGWLAELDDGDHSA